MATNIIYEPIVGLRVYAQMQIGSKLFRGCQAEFGALPNILTCPICPGYPGPLPALNGQAVEYGNERVVAGGDMVQRTPMENGNSREIESICGTEEAGIYRYFTEPALVPLYISCGWIAEIKARFPKLPDGKRKRFRRQYRIPPYDAAILTASMVSANYFETVPGKIWDDRPAANRIMAENLHAVGRQGIDINPLAIAPDIPEKLPGYQESNILSRKPAEDVTEETVISCCRADDIIDKKNLMQFTDVDKLIMAIRGVLEWENKQVPQNKSGKTGLYGLWAGLVMKEPGDGANPDAVDTF